MAEDDLLVNFAIGDEPIAPKAILKGGTWRARRRAQKQEQWANNSLKRKENHETEQLAKRQRVESTGPQGTRYREAKQQRTSGDFADAESSRARQQPRQVISSLFSYNPEPKTEPQTTEQKESNGQVEPSNAPLTQEQLNFTSLGLAPRIAKHLTNKMNITKPTAVQKAALEQLLKNGTDAFIQAETGSGKTLAYLLPILQQLVQISADLKAKGKQGLSRTSGLFAIILVPTRELSKQIAAVLETLLRCANWLVAGCIIGGENKNHEKARLRNGVNILVATPGRLADHMDHTSILDASQVRWLVLDEGDRLMELGFEEDLRKIITKLDNRMHRGKVEPVEGLPKKRINFLCSATMQMDVQRLGDISLKNAVHVQATTTNIRDIEDKIRPDADTENEKIGTTEKAPQKDLTFSVPAQLKQTFTVVPAKLRLVTLYAFLKRSFAGRGSVKKSIVFLSCADSVDYHFEVFTHTGANDSNIDDQNQPNNAILHNTAAKRVQSFTSQEGESGGLSNGLSRDPKSKGCSKRAAGEFIKTWAFSTSLSGGSADSLYIYRLHGSLPQSLRSTTLKSFTKTTSPAVLLCTDVASRGLDLPDVDLVVEYDPPFSRDDHLHRIGRTARAGRDGRATIFLLPGCEEGYADVLRDERKHHGVSVVTSFAAEDHLRPVFGKSTEKMRFDKNSKIPRSQYHHMVAAENAASRSWEDAATEWQLEIERWTLDTPRTLEMARRAFQSHVRAYTTHVAKERHMFDIKELHLGHLAKAFGLRDKPGSINVPGLRQSKDKVRNERSKAGASEKGATNRTAASRADGEFDLAETDAADARRKMQMLAKKMGTGAAEFNIA